MTESVEQRGCDEKLVTVTEADLPLCCPLPGQRIWDAHPRVYLTIGKQQDAICPYCSTRFHLVDVK